MSETIQEVTGKTAGEYFVRLDALVTPGTVLYVYGGAAVALLGSGIRTTMDVDVAESYSHFDRATFAAASAKAGLPVNPGAEYESAFLELVGAQRGGGSRRTGEGRGAAAVQTLTRFLK